MRWVGHVANMGEGRGMYRVLVVKPEGKRPFGRPRCRWEDNIKMDLQEVRTACTTSAGCIILISCLSQCSQLHPIQMMRTIFGCTSSKISELGPYQISDPSTQ